MSGIVIGAVVLLSIAWIGTVLYIRREKRALVQHHRLYVWDRHLEFERIAAKMVTAITCKFRERLEKVEQWERWIVKLQKAINRVEKCRVADRRAVLDKQWEFERVAANMAEALKRLAPLANALNLARQPEPKSWPEKVVDGEGYTAYRPMIRRCTEPAWEELTSRPAQPFAATGVTYTGTR